jgi:hypothetical protein
LIPTAKDAFMDFREPSRTLPNRSILGFAETYFEAGTLLYHKGPGHGFYLPAANLLCHSIELYLKSLANPAKFEAVAGGIYKEVTSSKRGHCLSKMLDEKVEPVFRDELAKARGGLFSDLKAIEGLFQASRYPFEENYKASLVEGKDHIAFEVAQFLSCAVSKLEPILVDRN